MDIKKLRDNPEYAIKSAHWFHKKWKVPQAAYMESIEATTKCKSSIPQWYIIMENNNIIAGAGVIENDFHSAKEYTPNICALYVEENYRKQGIAKTLLNYICQDMSDFGFKKLYLVTELDDFYEKCNWEYIGDIQEDSGENIRLYGKNL